MKRLRVTNRGWFRVACSWLVGSTDRQTGRHIPDPRYPNLKMALLLIGPFATAEEALRS